MTSFIPHHPGKRDSSLLRKIQVAQRRTKRAVIARDDVVVSYGQPSFSARTVPAET